MEFILNLKIKFKVWFNLKKDRVKVLRLDLFNKSKIRKNWNRIFNRIEKFLFYFVVIRFILTVIMSRKIQRKFLD
jgi:hypothetical protein